MSDPVGDLIAEYAAETVTRNSPAQLRADVAAAAAALRAAESRVTRAQEDRGMKRAALRRAMERLAARTGTA